MALKVLVSEHFHQRIDLSLNFTHLAIFATLCCPMEQLSNKEVNDQVLQEVVAVVDQADESLLILFVFHTDAIELDLLLTLHLDALADSEPEFLDCIKNTNSIRRQSHRSQIDIS